MDKNKCKTIDDVVNHCHNISGLPIDTFFYHYMLVHFDKHILVILKNTTETSVHDLHIMIAASHNMILNDTNRLIVEEYKNRKV